MARLPYPDYEDKNFKAAGKPTINVFKLLSYSAGTVDLWTSIGNAHFTKITFSKKQRELIILLSSAKFGSYYEWTHHIPLSTKFGVTHEQREEMKRAAKVKGYFSDTYWKVNPASFDEQEQVILTFLEAVIDAPEVDEEIWQKATEKLSQRQIVELITMQGFYYTLGRVTTALKIDMEGGIKPRL
ncbi:hypothetical protein H072_11338 [Dactylellina haptotyla CBS 200.50]|uniref:Carboxymuconolactone decarboxylase-like domain-containing protein n=1 Tax=Dactylellina haptotyla (strain CBS 200.50) TaxID=1284197 RepID=S8A289_DACHA|nr:hypothetical protein H072_11338 [Dactylellina haptotyla CBS 200.50]